MGLLTRFLRAPLATLAELLHLPALPSRHLPIAESRVSRFHLEPESHAELRSQIGELRASARYRESLRQALASHEALRAQAAAEWAATHDLGSVDLDLDDPVTQPASRWGELDTVASGDAPSTRTTTAGAKR
jgi:hypothetical protein